MASDGLMTTIENQAWTGKQIAELRARDPFLFARLEAAAMLYLEARSDLLCDLSCESGEWPESKPSKRHFRRVVHLHEEMHHQASLIAHEDDAKFVLWGVLNELAERYQYSPSVNWTESSE